MELPAFVYLNYTVNTLGSSSQRTAFYYDTDHQGNAQYGQWTRRKEYQDDGVTLVRTLERWFYPQTVSGYIVNRVAQEKLWAGEAGSGTCQGQTRYIYDNAANYQTPPTKGDLTKARVAQTTCDSSWSDTAYGYDSTGNQTGVTDPLGNVTTTAYDSLYHAYVTTVTLPPVGGLNFVTTYTWDTQLGQVTQVTDPNNAVTTYTYDQWGRLLTVKRPPDTVNTEEYAYSNYVASPLSPFRVMHKLRDDAGDDNYLYAWTFYDGLGRVMQTQREASSTSSILVNREYDGLGNLKRESLPYFYGAAGGTYRTPDWGQPQRQYTYDALGRVIQGTNPDGTIVRSYYQDRQMAVLDELNHQTIQDEDGLGRLVGVKQYTGSYPGGPGWNDPPYGTTSYGYDVADRLTGVTGPDGAQTTITYDLAGRKTSMSDPDMGDWSYAYDAAGNLTRQTDARNQTVCFYYDALNRLTGKHYRTDTSCPTSNPSLNVSYTYDQGTNGKGRRTGMTDSSGSTSWVYDARGRMTKDTKVINGTAHGATSERYCSMSEGLSCKGKECSMWRKLLLLGWIVGILFPFGWLCVFSDTYRQVFDTLFGPLWMHIVMHILLYCVLAYLLAWLLLRAHSQRIRPYHFGFLFLAVLIVALLQEGLQLLYQGWLPGADEWLDTGVDLIGGLLGIVIFRLWARKESQRPCSPAA